jgi:hypothetical protein
MSVVLKCLIAGKEFFANLNTESALYIMKLPKKNENLNKKY